MLVHYAAHHAVCLTLCATLCRWVMSFERPNLHFAVRRKQHTAEANFAELLEAGEQWREGGGGA